VRRASRTSRTTSDRRSAIDGADRMGARAVARDVAGGVGGVEQEVRGQPMNDRLEAISRLIAAVARQENQELRPLGRGIAFVPELAFAYLVGKAVTAQSSDIFGTRDVRWRTTNYTRFGDGRPDDPRRHEGRDLTC